MTPISIPYGPKWRTALFGLLFAGGFAVAGVWLALSPSDLAKVPFLRPFGQTGASAVMLVGASACAAVAVASAYLLFSALARRRTIDLNENSLVFPHGLLRTSRARIPYGEIRSVQVEPLGMRRAIRIRATSTTILIVEPMLPSPEHIELLEREISTRASAHGHSQA